MIKELSKEQRLSAMYYIYDEFKALNKLGLYETAIYKFPMCYYGKREVMKSWLYFYEGRQYP